MILNFFNITDTYGCIRHKIKIRAVLLHIHYSSGTVKQIVSEFYLRSIQNSSIKLDTFYPLFNRFFFFPPGKIISYLGAKSSTVSRLRGNSVKSFLHFSFHLFQFSVGNFSLKILCDTSWGKQSQSWKPARDINGPAI